MRARFLDGAIWNFTGAATSRVLLLLAGILAARLLGRQRFGEFGMVQATVSMFGQYAGFGLGLTATKHVAELKIAQPQRAGRILGLTLAASLAASSLMLVLVVLLAPLIAGRVLGAPYLTGALALSGVLVFFMAQTGVVQGALSGLEDFKSIARANLLQGAVNLLLMYPLVHWLGLRGAILSVCAAQGCCLWVSLLCIRERAREAGLPLGLGGSWSEKDVLWHYTLPSFLAGALLGPANWLASALVAQRSGGFLDLAGYNAANQWRSAILFVPTTMRQVSLPILASLHGSGDPVRYRRALLGSFAVNTALALSVAIPVVLASPWLMETYGAQYRGDWGILALLALGAVLEVVGGVTTQVTMSLGKLSWELMACALWSFSLVAVTWVLSPALRAQGLAIGLVCAAVAYLTTNTIGAVKFAGRRSELGVRKTVQSS